MSFYPNTAYNEGQLYLKRIRYNAGIEVGGYNINNFRYAYDTTLVSDREEKLQHLFNIIVNESKEKGLCIKIKETEYMVISKKETIPVCKIYIHGKRIRQVKSFNYVGSTVSYNGKCYEDIRKRIVLTKASFTKMSNILKSGKV